MEFHIFTDIVAYNAYTAVKQNSASTRCYLPLRLLLSQLCPLLSTLILFLCSGPTTVACLEQQRVCLVWSAITVWPVLMFGVVDFNFFLGAEKYNFLKILFCKKSKHSSKQNRDEDPYVHGHDTQHQNIRRGHPNDVQQSRYKPPREYRGIARCRSVKDIVCNQWKRILSIKLLKDKAYQVRDT